MTKQISTNYHQELLQYFQVYGTMLDIGCRSLDYLFQFDNSKFRKLIGIDLILPADPFQNYFEFKNPNPKKIEFDYGCLERRFAQKYRLFEKNILDFHIKKEHYGFIFCKHVIHFIPHDAQAQLIDNLYCGLKNKGILFLIVNHNQNKQYLDRTKCERIGQECFKEIRKGIIHYLSDPDEMLKSLIYRFDLDLELKKIDDKSVTALIRKK